MTISYEKFLPHVLPHVANCFEDQAIIAIRNACIDFCRETLLFQQDLDPITVQTGVNTYEIDVPNGYVLGQVLGVYYMTRRLERKSQMELERAFTRNWQSLEGTPQAYTQFNQDEITLVLCPAETHANALTGRFSYLPSRTSTTVDNVLYERYLEDIVAGALSHLMATPNQPYTDTAASAFYASKFRTAKQNTRSFVAGGMNHAPMRARYNRIW